MVDDRHVHGAEHAIRHRTRTWNLQKMASLMLGHGIPRSNRETYCIQFDGLNSIIVCMFLIDDFRPKAYGPAMKPMIPSDTTSKALGSGRIRPGRPSLHDEILARLRDYIVEGNIPDGDACQNAALRDARHLADAAA